MRGAFTPEKIKRFAIVAAAAAALSPACFANEDSFGVMSMEQYCTNAKHDTLDTWKKFADNILVGRVVEVRSRFNASQGWTNQCWARLTVSNSIKGENGSELWASIVYDAYNRPYDGSLVDYKNPEFCPLKKDREYLLFGVSNSRSNAKEAAFSYIIAAAGSLDDHCMPIIPIERAQQQIERLQKR